MLDIRAARTWLRDHLPDEEPVHIDDPDVLDRAAQVVSSSTVGAETLEQAAS